LIDWLVGWLMGVVQATLPEEDTTYTMTQMTELFFTIVLPEPQATYSVAITLSNQDQAPLAGVRLRVLLRSATACFS
jgi:hypothetical protein